MLTAPTSHPFGELAKRLDWVLLRKTQGHSFELVHCPPAWFYDLFARQAGSGSAINLHSVSIFLEAFITEAQVHWAEGLEEVLHSGAWHEYDDEEREYFLDASATTINGDNILALHSLGTDYEVRVQLFQKARNHILQSATLDNELQKNDVFLQFLAAELAPVAEDLTSKLLALKNLVSDPATAAALGELIHLAAKHDILIDRFQKAFSSEISSLLHVGMEGGGGPVFEDLVRKIVKAELHHFLTHSVGLSFDSTVPRGDVARVHAQATRLERVIVNLLQHSLRLAPEGTSITLQLHQHGQEWLLFEVHEMVSSLGEVNEAVFDQLLTLNESFTKASFALYYCHQTVKRWGGDIGYRRLGEGGCWWIRLRRSFQV